MPFDSHPSLTKPPKSLLCRAWHAFNKWGWTDHTTTDIIANEASHYRRIKTLLSISGLYHERECHTDFGRVMRGIKVGLLVSFVILQCLWHTRVVLKTVDSDYNARAFVVSGWHWQAVISTIFLICWQRQNGLDTLLKSLPWPSTSPSDAHIRKHLNFVFLIYAIHAVVSVVLTAFVFSIGIKKVSMYMQSEFLTSASGVYSHLILVKTIVLHVVTSVTVYHEILKVNDSLKTLSKTNYESDEEFKKKFLDLYTTHNNLAAMVRRLDRFFQVYTFVLIAFTIPVLVFTALDVMDNLGSKSQMAIGIPLIVFCCIELTALTAMPAKLHIAMHNTASMILENPSIWYPYDESVYQIANVFVSHIRETNLGITLWGFAVVNKPTIMATASVALTFFTFVIQAKWHATELHQRFANLTSASPMPLVPVLI